VEGQTHRTHIAPVPSNGELVISPIRATFTGCPSGGPFPPTPPECATTYSVGILRAPAGAAANLHFEWYIQLKLVDAEGSPPNADFDPTCTNAELPKGKVVEGAAGQSGVVYYWSDRKDFVWYHGDPGVYSDNPTYGCDHSREGPSGHQGIVTLIVDDEAPGAKYPAWVCQANYYGTDTGTAPQEETDCRPASADPGQRFLVAVAFNDELTAKHMLESKRNKAGAKAELEHSLADLKAALGQEKRYPIPDPFWVQELLKAIHYDDAVLNDLPNAKKARAALELALDAKDKLLEDAADDEGWAPPPLPLPRPGR
jgi:hypothetical protein